MNARLRPLVLAVTMACIVAPLANCVRPRQDDGLDQPDAHFARRLVGLAIADSAMPFAKRVLLIAYAKLARCYDPSSGMVRDSAHVRPGWFDNVPATGFFCLATCAAADAGLVERAHAQAIFRKAHGALRDLPKAHGLLPHFVREAGGRRAICPGTEFSTVDTAIAYEAMLIAAQMLGDSQAVSELSAAVRAIDFPSLRDANGYILHGLRTDGRTRIPHAWRGWGGESALVVLLERVACGKNARLMMGTSGEVFRGVGFIAEIQSLFYPHFDRDEPDAVTGVNWLRARRKLLVEQMAYFPRNAPHSLAAKLGLYGLSAGEGPRGRGYVANGTRMPNVRLIHPHYILMSATLRKPHNVYALLRTMEAHGLMPPWGMVENVTADLSHALPHVSALNAAFECLGAYHLWAKSTRRPDAVYRGASACLPLAHALRAFYPAP